MNLREQVKQLGIQRPAPQPFGVRWTDDVQRLKGAPSVMFDVGANVGQTVEAAVRAFRDCCLYAYEPVPATFSELQRRAAHLPQVTPVQIALSDSSGTAHISTEGVDERNHLVGEGEGVEVTKATVDDEMDRLGLTHLDVLKIDTEGHEVAVLNGARSALSEHRVDFVIAECDFAPRPEEPHAAFADLVALLDPLGYRVCCFYTAAVEKEPGWAWGDVLFKAPTVRVDAPFSRRPRLPLTWQKPVLRA